MADQVAKIVARLETINTAIAGWKDEVVALRAQVADFQENTPPEIDLSPILAALDSLEQHIEIEMAPPAEEEPVDEEPPTDPTPEPEGVNVGEIPVASPAADLLPE